MLWIALTPLLLLGLAVGLVPVIIGIVHDNRARQHGEALLTSLFPATAASLVPSRLTGISSSGRDGLTTRSTGMPPQAVSPALPGGPMYGVLSGGPG